jgi:hypothetical protein
MPGKPVRIINPISQEQNNVKKESFLSKIVNKVKNIFK